MYCKLTGLDWLGGKCVSIHKLYCAGEGSVSRYNFCIVTEAARKGRQLGFCVAIHLGVLWPKRGVGKATVSRGRPRYGRACARHLATILQPRPTTRRPAPATRRWGGGGEGLRYGHVHALAGPDWVLGALDSI